MAPIFRALADPGRRVLLDRLFERDGQTLGELTVALPEMTQFGVMKHLRVLEAADLVTTQKVGREKRHFLNPVPIRLAHDRWIGKFAEPVVGAMSFLKRSLEAPMDPVDHVYSVYIKASPERIWRAITDGDDTVGYYFGTRVASTWESGAKVSYAYPDGSIAADGEVLEIEPGRRVAMAFRPRWSPEIEARGPGPHDAGRSSRVIGPNEPSRLVVTTAMIPGSRIETEFTGGIELIVSGLKTLLETGHPLAADEPASRQ